MTNGLAPLAARMLEIADDCLFPQGVCCLCCDRALGEPAGDGLCPACALALEQLAKRQEALERLADGPCVPGVSYVHAAYPYEAQARTLVHRLKFESVRAAAVPLAGAMALLPSGREELIVPVPTDRRRRRSRGFNQAAVLAQLIGSRLGMEVQEALVRVSSRMPQTGLDARARSTNLIGCMKVSAPVSGKRILLVDDVVTTGATVEEAARALYEGGAKSVGVFAAARAGIHDGDYSEPFPRGAVRRF